MKPGKNKSVYKSEEDRRTAMILFRIILALLAAYLVVIISGSYWGDWIVVSQTLITIVFLLVPFGFLARGYVQISANITIISVLCSVTIIATNGQGIHDIAIMAYPVIVVIASLLLPRRDFFVTSFLVMLAMGWLVLGEAYGLFISRSYEIPRVIDFMVVAVILLVAILVVDLLAQNVRENMHQAQQEILQRKAMEEQLRDQGIHDALTGIYNRTFFEEELMRLERGREFPVGIIVADIDNLKTVNDRRGHAAGDELIRSTTTLLRAVFRVSDVLARIGGDEFAVLLPQTDSMTVEQILVRVHSKLIEYNSAHPDLPVQLSLGTATSTQGKLMDTLVLADERMYADKALRKSII